MGQITGLPQNVFWISKINVYFQISNPKLLFRISEIIILDIRNYAKKAFYLRYPKKLFWISKITISDIRK